MNELLIKDGFVGERMVYVPGKIKKELLKDTRTNDLYITHIGHFPHAKGHYRNRKKGCNQYIFIYCRSGEGWIILDNKKHIIKENQAFIIPPKTICAYGANNDNPWDNYWIHFTGENAALYTPECKTTLSIPKTPDARIEDRMILFEEILQSMEHFSNINNVVYANITLKYFLTTIRYIDNYRISNDKPVKDFFNTAITYMKNNLSERITLKQLSLVCKCSESNLHKLFIKKMHCSPIDYFLQIKLQKSCKYLSNTNLKIKEIALKLGYDDPYYFSRLFTKHIGKSPMKYKNEEKE